MERLSGLDAFFLYLESPTQPLNVCCILELDPVTMPGDYTSERFREALSVRVDAVPEFRLKLADNQLNFDHPVWVDDEHFDLTRHLHRVGLPSPGGHRELASILHAARWRACEPGSGRLVVPIVAGGCDRSSGVARWAGFPGPVGLSSRRVRGVWG